LHFKGGVLGRLVDLCRPTQRRFNLAVTVAAGKDMDGIGKFFFKKLVFCIVITFMLLDPLIFVLVAVGSRALILFVLDNNFICFFNS
jgi:hypothetical protein